jgi:hypothetical protein
MNLIINKFNKNNGMEYEGSIIDFNKLMQPAAREG